MFGILAALLAFLFAVPLWRLIGFALHSDLQSHVLLVPFISLYLVYLRKRSFVEARSSPVAAVFFGICGALALAVYWFRGSTRVEDALIWSTLAFVLFIVALALGILGWSTLRPHGFALGFLFFTVPLPLPLVTWISIALQHASAELSEITLRMTGMPVYREHLTFQMPGLAIFVAEECSGIRSTLVLFITSILAAHLFLRTGWKKALFIFFVLPLGVLRNAFRITTISWLTVNVDAGIIDSPLHHRGGPIFFVISLVPLFLCLWALRRSESSAKSVAREPRLP